VADFLYCQVETNMTFYRGHFSSNTDIETTVDNEAVFSMSVIIVPAMFLP
jgi:hypothetical protein